MAETIPTSTPLSFLQGDRVKWRIRTEVNGVHLDPADSWVLDYELRNESGPIDFSSSDNGDGYHLVDLSPTVTGEYPSGVFFYQATVTLSADRYQVESGQICIEPDFASLSAHDGREWTEKVLEAIEATLLGKASNDQQAYSIAGRSLSRMNWPDLMDARDRLSRELRSLRQGEALSNGRPNSGIIRTRI